MTKAQDPNLDLLEAELAGGPQASVPVEDESADLVVKRLDAD